jgi:TM2 domain-containing membrane protein YozV
MTNRVDADFAEEVLAELYAYRRKRRWVAFLLWGTLGWFGAHRFYTERPASGLLMMFTLGGGLVWWMVDAFFIGRMVREHDGEQARREAFDLPPVQLSFMPPLSREVLERPPEWTLRWRARSSGPRMARMTGDVLLLMLAGVTLGAVARRADVWEAVFAVTVLVALSSAGAAVGRFGHLPVVYGLVRWSHRLRLFYYYCRPGNSFALLIRPLTGALLAPFQRRARAEASLYLQLGGIITVAFLVLDFGAEVLGPVLGRGALPSLTGVFGLWIREAVVTFLVIYCFATPVGAVLTKHLLLRRTHTVPRLLGAVVLICMAVGVAL